MDLFESANVTGALEVVKTGIGLDHMRALDKLVAATAALEEVKLAYARRKHDPHADGSTGSASRRWCW